MTPLGRHPQGGGKPAVLPPHSSRGAVLPRHCQPDVLMVPLVTRGDLVDAEDAPLGGDEGIPRHTVERELSALHVLLDGRGLHVVGLVALPSVPAVALLAGVGDLHGCLSRVHHFVPGQFPRRQHEDLGDPVLVGHHAGLGGDGLGDHVGEPLRVPTGGNRIDHHVDVLDGLLDDKVPDGTADDVDVLGDSLSPSDLRQHLHQGSGSLIGHVGGLLRLVLLGLLVVEPDLEQLDLFLGPLPPVALGTLADDDRRVTLVVLAELLDTAGAVEVLAGEQRVALVQRERLGRLPADGDAVLHHGLDVLVGQGLVDLARLGVDLLHEIMQELVLVGARAFRSELGDGRGNARQAIEDVVQAGNVPRSEGGAQAARHRGRLGCLNPEEKLVHDRVDGLERGVERDAVAERLGGGPCGDQRGGPGERQSRPGGVDPDSVEGVKLGLVDHPGFPLGLRLAVVALNDLELLGLPAVAVGVLALQVDRAGVLVVPVGVLLQQSTGDPDLFPHTLLVDAADLDRFGGPSSGGEDAGGIDEDGLQLAREAVPHGLGSLGGVLANAGSHRLGHLLPLGGVRDEPLH